MKAMGKVFLSGLLATSAAVCAMAQTPQEEQDANRPPVISRDTLPSNQQQPDEDRRELTQKADGSRRRDLPIEAYAVTPGTKFLVKIEDELGTADTTERKKFRVRTMEPLLAGSGIYLPAGAVITGHVSRVEPASVAGRARIYLTFDEIKTNFGALPIVVDVTDVPGDHSVKVRKDHEGVVETRASTQQASGQAAGEGAAHGAVRGIKDKNAKEAAEGALTGALAAYLMESGRGHELFLRKGAKLELELERALYLVRE